MKSYLQILNQFWGYPEFRPLQEQIIESVGKGKDTLALLPTGGGKSITFQVPALALDGICIVITPLIALMKDQVENLKNRQIKAIAIHSGLTREEIRVALDNCIFGAVKFLYVSPERIDTEIFRIRVRDMNVNLIAVDEAHCISQWGYDFRPSYLTLSGLRELLPDAPVLALTATATPEVCEDIQEKLKFREKNLLRQSFERKNLVYLVRNTEDKYRELIRIIKRIKGSGIVYTRSRKKCRELSDILEQNGFSSDYYHAGLKHSLRDKKQQAWMKSNNTVIVATNAFGMGIDKPDVRFVIHFDLPDSPEAYFQEAGRAGRDGKKAYAILLHSPSDHRVAAQRLEVSFPGIPKVREIYNALCNYLQVPVGGGRGQQFDFEFGDFLSRYRLNANVAHSALTVLSREGYISVTEEINNPSRVFFLVGRDDLYRFQVKHARFDGFIKLLLRSYSGFFSQYVNIDENLLARRSGIPVRDVCEYLKKLATLQIIHYIPRKNVPVVTFPEERLETKNLFISAKKYNFRKERFTLRLNVMLRYASSDKTCRSRFLLAYFGEKDASECGQCDVCRKKNDSKISGRDYNRYADRIRQAIGEEHLSVNELVGRVELEEEQVITLTEWLMDRGMIKRDRASKLYWKDTK